MLWCQPERLRRRSATGSVVVVIVVPRIRRVVSWGLADAFPGGALPLGAWTWGVSIDNPRAKN